jgi:hypothetical protein
VGTVAGAVVEIACDESGFSGTNLLHPASPVIAHASVDLRIGEAVELITALRSGFRFSPREFKSGQFLRSPAAGEALEWFLAALRGRAHVHLVDKEYFLVTRIVDLLLAEPSYAAGTCLTQEQRPAALTLYRAAHPAGRNWQVFLAAFVELFRIKRRRWPDPLVLKRFFQARDALLQDQLGAQAEDVIAGLSRARVRAVLTRLFADDPSIPPPLEPMLPALAETVLFWAGDDRRQVLVTHDEQSALTAGRLRRLQQVLADRAGSSPPSGADETGPASAGISPLAGLLMVDSRDDPRVQVADLLAGMARRLPEIIDDGPLQPFVSPTSLRDPQPRRTADGSSAGFRTWDNGARFRNDSPAARSRSSVNEEARRGQDHLRRPDRGSVQGGP